MLLIRLIFVAVFCYQHFLCSKMLCPIDDSNCLTEGAKRIFKQYINGEFKGFAPSDPLHVDLIEGDLPTVKYTVTNATLSGFRNCAPELVRIYQNNMTFDYHLACEHLIGEGFYEVTGELACKHIEGKGDYRADHYDYIFLFHGECEFETDKDKNLHIQIKNYVLDIDVRDKVVYDFRNMFNGDCEKSAAMNMYINENWKTVDETIRQPLMEKFMSKYIQNANAFTKAVPADQMFSYEV